jgi:hypothetical protein
MTYRSALYLGQAITLGLLTACGPKDTAPTSLQPATNASPSAESQTGTKEEAPSFDPDKGLYLPEATRQSMGIATVPVKKKAFQAERTMKFQVFREANEEPLPGMSYRTGYAYASTILTDQKSGLKLGQIGEVLEKHDSQKASAAKLFQLNVLPKSNQTELLVEIADPQHQFALSYFCTVRWQMASVEAPAAVPDPALLRTTEGNFVYLLQEDRFVRTEVKLGATGEGFTEIIEGVAVGDSVVTNPVQTLWLTELKLKTGGSAP